MAAVPPPQDDAPPLVFGPYVLDLAAGRLWRDGHAVVLAPKPYAVLVHLARLAGRLVTKDELLDAVWGHRHVSDSALKVAINGLRSSLGDDAAAPRYIETAARRGYRFIAAVQGGPAAAIAPPVTMMPAAGNLPARTAALVGRDAAMNELHGLLQAHRLVTLVGPGGIGKTQLALATARRDPPPGGVWLVRLEALADDAPLLDTVARTLALGANASRSVQDLATALTPLSLRVVLDNAEHLIAAVAPLVSLCLTQAPQVRWLVTSQIPLRVAGEVLLPLQPLDVPPLVAGDDADDLLAYSAVALFVERARAVHPGFTPDAAMLQDIAALCRLLDGLPLALELAAARVPLLGTAGVLARIGDRFALLSRGPRDAVQRHRTLRSALEWSFGLLRPDELRVLRRLSVFAGSFTPGLAQAVVGDDANNTADWAVLDALQLLQEQSLLAIDPSHHQPRLRLLESVRALAAEHLAQAGEEGATRTRLAEALRDVMRTAHAHYTRTPLLQWLQPLRPEADNLRLAMSHALTALDLPGSDGEHAQRLHLALELASSAMLFWLRSGRKREAQQVHLALAVHAQKVADDTLRADWGLATGALAAYSQSLPPAEALPGLDEAERIYTQQGQPRQAMLALYLNAALNQRMAPGGDRTPLLLRMRALQQPDWSLRERNFAAWTEAVNAHGHGDLQAFRDFCAEDLARARASDDRAEAWVAAFGLGQALWTLGERQRAMDTLVQAVDDLRDSGLLREYATTAALAAGMRVALSPTPQQLPQAEAAAREAADLLRAEGMLWWLGEALAMLPARKGHWPAALRLQAWIDQRMQALGMKRSPVASTLREDFDGLLAAARTQPAWHEPPPAPATELDDADVLRLAFNSA